MADYDESIRKIGDLAALLQSILEQSRDHMANCHSAIGDTSAALGNIATDAKLDTIIAAVGATNAKLDSLITAIGTTNTTLGTISTTLAAIKAKTDGLNYNGLNLRVTGLL